MAADTKAALILCLLVFYLRLAQLQTVMETIHSEQQVLIAIVFCVLKQMFEFRQRAAAHVWWRKMKRKRVCGTFTLNQGAFIGFHDISA